MLLDYENTNESNITITEFKLYDDDEQIYIASYNNADYILYLNYVYLNKNASYTFDKDVKTLGIEIFLE